MSDNVLLPPPKNLNELLEEVISACPTVDGRANMLLTVVKKHHFWPMLQVKVFFSNPNLVLLHNTYKRTDVDHFQKLYDECRSVVLDMTAPLGENIVISLPTGIPERFDDRQYEMMKDIVDRCEQSYEGTMIVMYAYDGKWHFGTSGCPTIDASRYHHPTKTHGVMMDECIQNMFPNDVISKNEGEENREFYQRRGQILRGRFSSLLDDTKTYTFLMVHHENRHVMDYTEELGEEYKVIFHLNTKDKDRSGLCQSQESTDRIECLEEKGIKYVRVYDTPEEALRCIREGDPYPQYGFIVKRSATNILRVSSASIVLREETDLGNHNKWHNMLWIFLQNKCHYTVEDYVKQYAADIDLPKDNMDRVMEAPVLVRSVVDNIVNTIYRLYISTTRYNIKTRRFTMDKKMDGELPPILRFHLGQLRRLQITDHTHATINYDGVYDYIRHHQTLKNIRLLIKFFAGHKGPEMATKEAENFVIFDKLLVR